MDVWKAVLAVLALALAGCGAPSGRKAARGMDWESPEFAAAHQNEPPPVSAGKPVVAVPRQHSIRIYKYEMTWLPLEGWCEHNQRVVPVRLNGTPPAWSLNVSNRSLVLRGGSTSAQWDGLEVKLGFAPHVIDGRLFVHGLDFEKTIDPLLNQWAAPARASHPIAVIDPGHGGSDPGAKAAGSGYFEKDLTLDWALRLVPLITANGWQVFLTRTNDVTVALSNRVAFAEAHRADLFISLHFNSSSEGRQRGLETYCLTPSGMQSTIMRGEDDSSASFPNNAFDAQNLGLAYRVHSALVRATASNDRGVRRARFPAVLRNQNRPAILVEAGYLSNREEAERIIDPGYRQTVAEAVCKAICGLDAPIGALNPGNEEDTTANAGAALPNTPATP